MNAVRITMTMTAEPGTDWNKVINDAALAASEAVEGECVILLDARTLPPRRECRRPRVWPVWS